MDSQRGTHRRGLAGGLIGVAMTCAVSCSEAPTQIVVVVDAEPALGPQLQFVNMTMRREGTDASSDAGHYDLDRVRLRAPDRDGLVVLRPRDVADTRAVFVSVVGELRDHTSVSFTALTHFERGQTLYLYVPLSAACVPITCSAGTTCTAGRCEPVVVRALPQQFPTGAMMDAAARSDADAAVDAAEVGPDQPDVDSSADVHFDVVGDDGGPSDVSDEDARVPLDSGVDATEGDAVPDLQDALDEHVEDVADVTVLEAGSDVPGDFVDASSTDSPSADIREEAADVAQDGAIDAAMDAQVTDVTDAGAEGPADALTDALDADVAPRARCTPGTVLTGSRPTPLSPWSASYVGSSTPRLRWRMGPGIPSFPVCIEICRDRACTTIEDVIEAPSGVAGEASFVAPTRPLGEGAHFWRITAQNTEFLPAQWSPFSPTWEFFVTRRAPARTSDQTPMWGCVPDFNGDGLADGIFPTTTGRGGVRYVTAIRGTGLAGATSVPIANVFASSSVGDVNGDGFVDLVYVANTDSRPVVSFWAGGATGLSTSSGYNSGVDLGSFNCGGVPCFCRVVGDLNDDGSQEAICTGIVSPTAETAIELVYGNDLYHTRGGGVFILNRFVSGAIPYTVAGLFDANFDGVSDLAFSAGSSRIGILTGRVGFLGASTAVANSFPGVGTFERILVGGDFNGDGHVDLITENSSSTLGTRVVFGPVTSATPSIVSLPTSGLEDIWLSPVETVIDVNGDGLSDFVRGDVRYSGVTSWGGRVRVILGASVGTSPPYLDVPATVPLTYNRGLDHFELGLAAIPLGDSDGDGLGDFLIGNGRGSMTGLREMFFYRGVSDFGGDTQVPSSFPWDYTR